MNLLEREYPGLVANVKMWWSSFPEDERFEFELKCLELNTPMLPALTAAFLAKAQPMDVFKKEDV